MRPQGKKKDVKLKTFYILSIKTAKFEFEKFLRKHKEYSWQASD